MLQDYQILQDEVLYINFELDRDGIYQDVSQLNKLIDTRIDEHGEPEWICFDEIQYIDGWEHVIRSLYAKKQYKIIITWSNSRLISTELATFFTWRHFVVQVQSMTYGEFLDFTEQEHSEDIFLSYMKYWWMPEVRKLSEENRITYLSTLYKSIVYEDILKHVSISDITLFERILRFGADSIANEISYRSIEKYLKGEGVSVSFVTIGQYLEYARQVYLLDMVARYDIKWKKYLKFLEKIFWWDIGMRNTLISYKKKDIQKILENIVYHELKYRGYDIVVGKRWKNEIDFIAKKQGVSTLFIQVTYLLQTPETIEREFGNLKKVKEYGEKLVLSLDKYIGDEELWIPHKYLADWLLDN